MAEVYQLRNEKSYRTWDYAHYVSSRYNQTILFDLLKTYWDYPLHHVWSHFPFHVQTNEETIQFPYASMQLFLPEILLFDASTKILLEQILSKTGEFLPIHNHEKEIYFYHLLKKIPALDLEQSIVRRYPSNGEIANFHKLVFKPHLIKDQYLFQIPESSSRIFVTDQFVKVVKKYQLNGLRFIPVWKSSQQDL
ncbi:hypothetical protein SAMN05444392_11634 [Seinonella peptonophila]|uniref:Immunity MXAN-0049 protein domain-containing protein n=1 Tax=Seinonella peptonophila TaxID=112248 RepID=A0A1M5AVY6_9BACL|nr:DUF1629 domain-containing protein [Seinonella peptonophila]SHF34408.1 hypothetical protein SAMN05444392_11634 [Seinonella peptonophila]